MVEGVERIVHLVVVEQGQPVMHIGRARRIIERALIQRNRARVIPVRRLVLSVLDDLRAARSNHPVAASATQRKAERQTKRELLQGIFDHHRRLTIRMNSHHFRALRRFSLPAILRAPQYLFLIAALATTARAIELRLGNNYPLTFTDVDRHQLSTADGHITIISVVNRRDEAKAETVGDRVSQISFGDPKFRLITLVNFQQNILPPLRGMVSAVIRHRLDVEAKEIQKTYAEPQLNR